MPGRKRKVYVLPPSVAVGRETARSGTSWVPAIPPAWLNATRPSLVMRRTGHAVVPYATAVSIESRGTFMRTFSVPPRWPAPDSRTLTSTEPFVIATPSGPFPTPIRRFTAFVRGSICATVPPNWWLTQTLPAPTATAVGPSPVGMSPVTEFVAGSMRETVPSRLFATQAPPLPNARPVGPLPTAICATTLPVTGSIRTTRFAVLWVAHNVPAPKASSVAAIDSGFVGLPLSASILAIVLSPVFATHTEPAA